MSKPPSVLASNAPSVETSASSQSTDPIVVSQSIIYTRKEPTSQATFANVITSMPTSVNTEVLPPPVPLFSRTYSEPPNPVPTSTTSSLHGNGYGISYNPYNADNSCKDSGAIANDMHSFKDYGTVRLYGTDCYQLDTIMPAVKNYPGMKLILGIWHAETRDGAVNEATSIVNAVNNHFDGDWSSVHSVTVGNEVVHRGGSVNYLLDTLKAVKAMLSPYNVSVVTVETPDVFQNTGRSLCQESDFVAINAHPFFDRSGEWTDPSRAGDFVKLMVDTLKGCGDKRTVIMESGWPHGSTLPSDYFKNNNLPVPNPENHRIAIKALMDKFVGNPRDLVVFSAFDDLWKMDSDSTMGVEHFWGILPE